MTRLIIRHLSGAKANQESSFELDSLDAPITLGRDASNRIVFDDSDDAVSRQHARIELRGDGLWLVDAGSANGSFVNRVRVEGEIALAHGDLLQFGRSGPETSLQLDPPPATSKATRLVDSPASKATRLVQDAASAPAAADEPARVGRATVERLIGAEKSRNTRLVTNLVAGFVAVIGAVGLWQVLDGRERDAQVRAERDASEQRLAGVRQELESKANLSKRVKTAYGASTVLIEVSWRLTHSASGRQIYHSTMPVENKGNFPAYLRLDDGSLEPLLALEDRGDAKPIGGTHSGTGFVVAENGIVMTNRHVAAAWHAPYGLQFPGVVVERVRNDKGETTLKVVDQIDEPTASLANWVPSRSRFFKTRGVADASSVTGSVMSMTATFSNSKLRVPATAGTISPEHDVALVKIDAAAGHLKAVEMRDSYDSLASGDAVAVLGYPGASAKSYVITSSADTFVKDKDVAMVPEVSVNQGIVSKVLRGRKTMGSGEYVSTAGDIFEMSINSTGQGNSGGPVFDADGKVIGIFSSVMNGGRATLTGAVPIRYGLDLLDPTRSAMALR